MRGSAVREHRDFSNRYTTLDRFYLRVLRSRNARRERSEVSCCLKYFVFGVNFAFTLCGCIFVLVGVWAWHEKAMFANLQSWAKLTIDPALFLVIVGLGTFTIGFTGCTGALRENTCMLLMFCLSVSIVFCAEIATCILAFVYKEWVIQTVKDKLKVILVNYRDNVDLRDLIDWVQSTWLLCCGIEEPNDWEMNMYFNCSSPSAERCGVPPSCCRLGSKFQYKRMTGFLDK